MGIITFHEKEVKSFLTERKLFKSFLRNLFKSEKKDLQKLDIIFCTDRYLLTLNKFYLHHYYFTDTLSFLLSKQDELIIGEVYISAPRVKINSRLFKTPYQTELKRVIIHGCLHLCGYKDKPQREFKKMENIQEKYLCRWAVSRET